MESWVIGVGLGMGAVLILSVCYAWVRKQSFGTGGAVMSFVGVLLIGLSVFQKANLNVGADGVALNFEARLKEVADSTNAVSEEMGKLASTVEANQAGLLGVFTKLDDKKVLDSSAIAALRVPVEAAPKVDRARLKVASDSLSRISAESARRLPAVGTPKNP